MEHARQENKLAFEDAVQKVEGDARASIECAEKEMERALQLREDEIFIAATAKMEEEWMLRERRIRKEFKEKLSAELDGQHSKVASHYEAIIEGKDKAIEALETSTKHQLSEIKKHHQLQIEDMERNIVEVAEEVWKDACEKFGVAADEQISHSLAVADEHCNARDEEISMLHHERTELRKLASEKDSLLQDSVRELNKMENALEEVALEIHNRREEEVSKLSEEMIHLVRDNQRIKEAFRETNTGNELLKGELAQLKQKHNSLETQCSKQQEVVVAFDSEKQRLQSRADELSARKQLLERQLSDSKEQNKELTTKSEILTTRLDELLLENDQMIDKNEQLSSSVDVLRQKNADLERKHYEAIARVNALEQERREYSREMEDRIKQKDALLAGTLDSIKAGSKSRNEPVVVHLHGNSGESKNMSRDEERLSNECDNLQSKVIQLQRENFRLESDLMNKKQSGKGNCSEKKLLKENKSLKTVISMMRKEMESIGPVTSKEVGHDKSSLPPKLVLDLQLAQCQSYLDLLLDGRDLSSENPCGNEVLFLRSKYRELHRIADELREENAKLHETCNIECSSIGDDGPSSREKELIQRLEEATEEIEALLR